jgi:alkylation response protein AidB-like acyl-CoA dehydrogenase
MKLIPLPPMSFEEALAQIEADAGHWDRRGRWAESDPPRLAACGALRWAIAREFGGDGLSIPELHLRYERLATASVSTALVLTERDAALGLIDMATETAGRADWLRGAADGQVWVTGGDSDLTAEKDGNGYRLNGQICWCTAAWLADGIVTDASTADGRRVRLIVRRKAAGVMADDLPLVAMAASRTRSIRLKEVRIPDADILHGISPERSLRHSQTLACDRTCLTTGLIDATLTLIGRHESETGRTTFAYFDWALQALRSEIVMSFEKGAKTDASATARIQADCNALAQQVTHAAMALYKRNAVLADHPAQRFAREAMFLAAWFSAVPIIGDYSQPNSSVEP